MYDDEDDTDVTDRGLLSQVVRMSPPTPHADLAWVERYDRLVVTRFTCTIDPDSDDGVFETTYPTEARALQEVGYRLDALTARGYTPMED